MKQCIKIVYDFYEDLGNGNIRKRERISTIAFSDKTTEYQNNVSYTENMEAMVYDILENGFVFISDGIAIPIFNIKQYISSASINGEPNNNKSSNDSHKPEQLPNNRGFKKNKRMHRTENKQGIGFQSQSSNQEPATTTTATTTALINVSNTAPQT